MSHQSFLAVQINNGRIRKHRDAQVFCKIIFEKKIVVPFTQADLHAGILQSYQLFNHGLEIRVDLMIPAKPEVKKVASDKELVYL